MSTIMIKQMRITRMEDRKRVVSISLEGEE